MSGRPRRVIGIRCRRAITMRARSNLPHKEKKKADHQVKLGCFDLRMIGTWDLTAYGGMLNVSAKSDLEEELERVLEVDSVVLLGDGKMSTT